MKHDNTYRKCAFKIANSNNTTFFTEKQVIIVNLSRISDIKIKLKIHSKCIIFGRFQYDHDTLVNHAIKQSRQPMKKLFFTLLLIHLIPFAYTQERPYRIGIKGGINYIHLENYGGGYYADFEAKPGWGAGVMFEYTFGSFVKYTIAPELLFTQSVTDVDLLYLTDNLATIQSVDLPVSFKVGLQLSKLFRPYCLGNIYGSYIVHNTGDFFEFLDIDNSSGVDNINKFYIGASAGLGFDIWKFQVEGRYRWNLNRVITDDYKQLKQMGLEFSCAFLF